MGGGTYGAGRCKFFSLRRPSGSKSLEKLICPHMFPAAEVFYGAEMCGGVKKQDMGF